MNSTEAPASTFLLQAFDREQWCSVYETQFQVADLDRLRTTLGEQADDDPYLRHSYSLDRTELAAVNATFGMQFDPASLGLDYHDIWLSRIHSITSAPYLIHTGYELPLLLDGRKKLARMSDAYPPMMFEGEERFDHWVAKGFLYREEVLEPFDPPNEKYFGVRTVYYTPKGEEWRIPAMQLIWSAAMKGNGWNETLERLEGMLFGYEDWQMDWWITKYRERPSRAIYQAVPSKQSPGAA